jgi:hypothetical protein
MRECWYERGPSLENVDNRVIYPRVLKKLLLSKKNSTIGRKILVTGGQSYFFAII